MKGRRDVLSSPYFSCKPPSEMRGESRVSISDNLLRETKPGIDVLEVQGCYSWARNCGRTWEEQGRTRTAVIDYGENSILSSYLWETGDQIHGDLLKWKGVFWGSDAVKGNSRLVCEVFVLLTRRASGDIVSDPGLHPI